MWQDFVIRIIFQKALAEPHYCETYADMVMLQQPFYRKRSQTIKARAWVTLGGSGTLSSSRESRKYTTYFKTNNFEDLAGRIHRSYINNYKLKNPGGS